jgi:hypothetical protein
MADLKKSRTARVGQLACLATLLFVFFLPLHVHASLSSQLTNQCSCVQGARADFVVIASAPIIMPTPPFGVLLEPQIDQPWAIALRCRSVRGPPSTLAA